MHVCSLVGGQMHPRGAGVTGMLGTVSGGGVYVGCHGGEAGEVCVP
jgi:hypothetical protein